MKMEKLAGLQNHSVSDRRHVGCILLCVVWRASGVCVPFLLPLINNPSKRVAGVWRSRSVRVGFLSRIFRSGHSYKRLACA